MVGVVKKGYFVGRPPIGYDKADKKLVINLFHQNCNEYFIFYVLEYYIQV